MPRNLSESQLLQISSKAFSNVAGQFSKLGQSLNPNKNKTTNAATTPVANKTAQINPQVMRQSQSSIDKCEEATEKPIFTLGKSSKLSTSGSDSEENDSSIFEPDVDSDTELAITTAQANFNFNNENNFLPSVGIVMGNAQEAVEAQSHNSDNMRQLVDKDNSVKHTENVNSISISSVANNVTLPTGLLENAPPLRPITPNPQIYVQEDMSNSAIATSENQPRSVFYM